MKIKLATILLVIYFVSACGSFNDMTAELHLNKNISTGQELLDLQAALDKGIINQEEFDIEKEKPRNKELYMQTKNIDTYPFEIVLDNIHFFESRPNRFRLVTHCGITGIDIEKTLLVLGEMVK